MGRSFGSLHRNVFMVAVMGVLWKCTVGESDVTACGEAKCASAPATVISNSDAATTHGSLFMQQTLDQEKTGLTERSTSEVGMLHQKLDKLQKAADEQTALLMELLEEKEDQTNLMLNLLKRPRGRHIRRGPPRGAR